MMARRGEPVVLGLADVIEIVHGLKVTIRASNNDPAPTGRIVATPYGSDPATCPIRLLRAWLAILGIAQILAAPATETKVVLAAELAAQGITSRASPPPRQPPHERLRARRRTSKPW